MRQRRVSIVSRTRYHFHNMLVKGTIARIIALTIVTVALCFVLGFVLSLIPSDDGDLLTSIWNATLCALDEGTIAGMEANAGQKVALFIITLFGIVFTSVLVGIVTTGIEEQLEYFAHEGSKVYERRPLCESLQSRLPKGMVGLLFPSLGLSRRTSHRQILIGQRVDTAVTLLGK